MAKEESKKKLQELLVKEESPEWRNQVEFRKENKSWLKKSAKIAIKLNRSLRVQGMTQKELAEKLEVSPQMVNKILKGRENLTLETIGKLEAALGIELITILRSDEMVMTVPKEGFIMTKASSVSQVYSSKAELSFKEIVSAKSYEEDSRYALAV